MNRNIEVKTSILCDFEVMLGRVAAIADQGPVEIHQDDIFFPCQNGGRLKLRTFSSAEGELIFYQRTCRAEPNESRYIIAKTATPDSLREALMLALGNAGRVKKIRFLFFVGRSRIHLDRVDGLGNFLEIETVLREDELIESGMAEAQALLERLGLSSQQLIAEAYVDLLAKQLSSK